MCARGGVRLSLSRVDSETGSHRAKRACSHQQIVSDRKNTGRLHLLPGLEIAGDGVGAAGITEIRGATTGVDGESADTGAAGDGTAASLVGSVWIADFEPTTMRIRPVRGDGHARDAAVINDLNRPDDGVRRLRSGARGRQCREHDDDEVRTARQSHSVRIRLLAELSTAPRPCQDEA